MADRTTLILLALAGAPLHGYGIQQEIERRTGLRLGPGTLYGAIARLEAAGLVAPMRQRGRRRPYRITEAGRLHLSTTLQDTRLVSEWARSIGA
jgi:DNA-binding PadR family transcriptional regulator